MAKGLTISSIVIAVMIFLVFFLDLVTPYPFGGANRLMDAAFVICSIGLAYISWTVLRELR